MSRSIRFAVARPRLREDIHVIDQNASTVTTRPHQAITERRRTRGQAIRTATVLAGLLHLVAAALLIGIPASSPTFDEVPTPESNTTSQPPAALSARPNATPTRATSAPRRIIASAIAPTSRPRPTPTSRRKRTTPPAAGAQATPPRHHPHTPAALPDVPKPSKPDSRPTATGTQQASLSAPPETSPSHTPPGQGGQPPGQEKKSAQLPVDGQPSKDLHTPPGQERKVTSP
ncbi:hypothetical protein H4W80_002816 [Nonomuraea angiospora]|uniref:Uncharacterized protein n=1 Tax=Nonomuraea angiospora TaxID=46172 RepID=A0ABR9LV77_9ACTN|nr:hypothetical protein [Nonomuraea angiospora]